MYKLELKYIEYDENLSLKERRLLEHNIAYSLLDTMLSEHFDISSPTICRNENGKPYINKQGVHFSLSHTNGLAVCAVADTPIGVDCEKIVERGLDDKKRFASRYFTENEIEFLKNSQYSDLDFFKAWTGKEAVIKKLGGNMSLVKKIDITQENLLFSYENGYIICINV